MGNKRPNAYARAMGHTARRAYERGRKEATAEAEAATGAIVVGILDELGVEEVSFSDDQVDLAVRRYRLGHKYDGETKRTTYLLLESEGETKDEADASSRVEEVGDAGDVGGPRVRAAHA